MVEVDEPNNAVVNSLNENEELIQADEATDLSHAWIPVFTESFVTLIMAFSVFYLILEVNEVANFEDIRRYNPSNNIIEVLYLVIAFLAIAFHLHRFRTNRNSFYKIECDNYPMLFVMIICGLVDMGYYFLNFISIGTECLNITRIFSTFFELLFVITVLPFVVICVWNSVSLDDPVMKVKTKVTILLAMGGCIVIFMRKVSLRIEKDLSNGTLPSRTNCSGENAKFIHKGISKMEEILELVDICCILTVLVFLINPLKQVSNSETKETCFQSISLSNTLMSSVSMVRFRWGTIVLSIFLVTVLVSASYVATVIMDTTSLGTEFQAKCLIGFLCITIASYIIGIVYGTIYYFADIKSWDRQENSYTRSDEHFNQLTSTFQIIYAGSMILCLVYLGKFNDRRELILVQFFDFLLLAIQVLVQAGCISLASEREVKKNRISEWRSKLFPPVALASINLGCLVVSMVYSQNPIFIKFLQDFSSNKLVYIVMKDVALPITILNRLHGLAFFINLSIKQWNEKKVIA